MKHRVAIVGAGVSGLTCGVVFAERGHRTTIFAREIGQETTSAVAGALWFPYDVEPADKAIPWALETYQTLIELARNVENGVSMIELHQLSRMGEIQIPDWAVPLGARRLSAFRHGAVSPRRWIVWEAPRHSEAATRFSERILAGCSADGPDHLPRLSGKPIFES